MPAHQVVVAASFEQQLDGAFAADFQNIAVGDLGVAVVGAVIGVLQVFVDLRGTGSVDAGTFAQRFDRLVPDRVVELAQLGFRLGVVEQYLGVAQDRQAVPADARRFVGVVVDVELDDLIARVAYREVGGEELRGASDQFAVFGRDDRLLQAVVAVFELLGVGRRLVVGPVGETAAVAVQIGVDEVGVERPALAHRPRGEVPRHVVPDVLLVVVFARPHHLLFEHGGRREERTVLRGHVGRRVDERVDARLHQLFAGIGRLAQPFVVLVVFGIPRLARRRIDAVVFAVGSLEEADARLDGQCDVAVDLLVVDPCLRGVAVFAGVVEVFEHALHDVFAAVAGLVEVFLAVGADDVVVPGHSAEGLHQFEIVPCPPEARRTLVVGEGRFAHALRFVHPFEEGVDVVDEVPCAVAPTALQRGVPDGLVEVARRLFHLDDVAVAVAARDVARTRRVGVQEAVGVFFQRSFVLEIFVGADLLDRLLVEEILAGGERQTSQSRINYSFHSFVQIRR